jgi:hypothetical protein
MDGFVVQGNSQLLSDQQDEVEARFTNIADAAKTTVEEEKANAIAKIDSEIWKLGYGQPGAFDTYYDYSVHSATYEDHPIYRAINDPENFAQVADGSGDAYTSFNFDSLFYYPGKNEEHDLLVRNAIVDERERFEGLIKDTLTRAGQTVAKELDDAVTAFTDTRQDFFTSADFAFEAMTNSIEDAANALNEDLDAAKGSMEAETSRAKAALEDFLQERLADW